MMAPSEKLILFHYPQSIYSHRVLWYLWLRDLEYDECIQPPVMPRPDLASIGVNYRRIPIMAIGKDVYIDSRLIISKLETLYPDSNLAPARAENAGFRKLFEHYSDSGLFNSAVKLMPYWSSNSLVQDKTFLDDRQKLMGGRRMTTENMQAGRPEGLQNMRQAFELMENTFLADGRQWVLGSEGPTVADIDAVWPFEWLIVDRGMKGAVSEEHFGERIYPRTNAWIRRFMDEVQMARGKNKKPTALDGQAMSTRVLNTNAPTEPLTFDESDPLGFHAEDAVEVYPSDYGQAHKDRGIVVGLTVSEVVIRNSKGLHLHFPRWNFRITKISPASPSPTPRRAKKLPKMRLIYHPFSPFTRKVFVLAHELGLAQHMTLEKVVVAPIAIKGWSDNVEDVAKFNPMGKIPCLVTDDVPTGLFDSRVICEYLVELAGVRTMKRNQRYWQLRALHACADGIMDAAVLITYEVRIRKERGLYFKEWVEGQKTKMVRALDRFEAAASEGVLPDPGSGPASVDEIAVAVATTMMEQMSFLGMQWREGRPSLEKWLGKWEKRGSFVSTPPTKDWVIEGNAGSIAKL